MFTPTLSKMAEIRLVLATLQEYSEQWIQEDCIRNWFCRVRLKNYFLLLQYIVCSSQVKVGGWDGVVSVLEDCFLGVSVCWNILALKSLYVTSSREKFRLLFLTSVYELDVTQLLVICSREWAPDQRARTPISCIFPFRETDLLLCRGRKTTAVIKRRETPERERLKTAHWAA